MTPEEQLAALTEEHRRLRRVAQEVVDGCESAGRPERPLCDVPKHLIRNLRRELDGEPQPSFHMSIT